MKKKLNLGNDYLLYVSKLAALLLATAGNASPAAAWSESWLYSFTGGSDGGTPYAGLVSDPTGNLYGATCVGGSTGNGEVFKLQPNGTGGYNYLPLSTLPGGTDGACPTGPLYRDSTTGDLYGTAAYTYESSGVGYGHGVVFRVTPSGQYAALYRFSGSTSDGGNPYSGLAVDKNNNLYGTTFNGGTYSKGTVFKLAWSGSSYSFPPMILHPFAGGSDGAYPYAGVTIDSTATYVYGTTTLGGSSNNGTVFKVAIRHRPQGMWSGGFIV